MNDRGQLLCEGADMDGQVAVVLTPISAPIGDIEWDCSTNINDLLIVIREWGEQESVADINGDGVVNAVDLMVVFENWTVR